MLQFKTTLQMSHLTVWLMEHYHYWIKENDNISSTAEGINTSTLVLHNILPSDNGHYQCVAVNDYGRNYSNYATLSVTGITY